MEKSERNRLSIHRKQKDLNGPFEFVIVMGMLGITRLQIPTDTVYLFE